MSLRRLVLVVPVLAALAVPTAASAYVEHTVVPGETLWSIAAANNLTTRTVAAMNGLPPDGHVVLGQTIKVPTVAEGAAALAATSATAPSGPETVFASQTTTADGSAPATDTAELQGGAHVVQPGETLSGVAARAGTTTAALAELNGLAPDALLISGSPLRLPGVGSGPTSSEPAAAAPVSGPTSAAPDPAPGRVDAGTVSSVAANHGVPGDLAAAIGWQESGFNNAMVSSANARGVMQIIPGTWNWIQDNLASDPLDPASAQDNVHAGVMYLGHLLREAGGDPALAAAGYYQGLESVRERGMYDDTKRYVDNVLALRSRFGG